MRARPHRFSTGKNLEILAEFSPGLGCDDSIGSASKSGGLVLSLSQLVRLLSFAIGSAIALGIYALLPGRHWLVYAAAAVAMAATLYPQLVAGLRPDRDTTAD